MDELKFILYTGGIAVTIMGSWFAVKYQSKQNQKDIEEVNNRVISNFKKLDAIETRVSKIETDTTHFVTVKDIAETHPTKVELELHLKQLHKSDEDINHQMSQINNKLEKIMDILISGYKV